MNKYHGIVNLVSLSIWREIFGFCSPVQQHHDKSGQLASDAPEDHFMGGSRGGGDRGSRPPPLENHKSIGFLSNTGPDPLKTTKLPGQHSVLGHHRPARETPFKWRFSGGPMMAHL